MQSNSHILEALDLSVHLGGRPVLSRIQLALPRAQMIAVVGLNGAGKTTLLRSLSGALSLYEGQIRLDGREISTFTARERAQRMACVAQETQAAFPFTVRETVMMGRYPWRRGYFSSAEDLSFVDAALARLELTGWADRQVGWLSGGERQRVMLARALAQQTPIFLFDEPLNHLDIRHRAFVLDLLRDENRTRGVTVVAVMHDLRDVLSHFDCVVLMSEGQIFACGSVCAVLTVQNVRTVFGVDPERVGVAA